MNERSWLAEFFFQSQPYEKRTLPFLYHFLAGFGNNDFLLLKILTIYKR